MAGTSGRRSPSYFLIKPASALSEFSVYFNPELHNHTIELQYEVGHRPAKEVIAAHGASPRNELRGLARCARAMREGPGAVGT